jgi:Fic family protein
MTRWIWNHPPWPALTFDAAALAGPATGARLAFERVLAKTEALAPADVARTERDVWSGDTVATAAIEGETLPLASVRSSIARRLGLDSGTVAGVPQRVEGLLDTMENAAVAWDEPLTDARLCQWQAALFPAGGSALRRLEVGRYRTHSDPMQIVSGPMGRETVHYEAPPSSAVPAEMSTFLAWFEDSRHGTLDGVLRAGLAHVRFESIHPFEDGNGRVGRAIVDLALAQYARRATRLHGLSSELERERDAYYAALNDAQRGTGDVTAWLAWFLAAFEHACRRSLSIVDESLVRARFWSEHRELEMNERQRKVLNRMLDAGPGRFEGGLTTRKYVGMTGASPATASRDIADLVAKGLLAPGAAGGRSTYYDLAIRGWEWRPA